MKPLKRDVYYWNSRIGVLKFKDALFLGSYPGGKCDRAKLIWILDEHLPYKKLLADKGLLDAQGTKGLLWAARVLDSSKQLYPGDEVTEAISVICESFKAKPRTDCDGKKFVQYEGTFLRFERPVDVTEFGMSPDNTTRENIEAIEKLLGVGDDGVQDR